MAMLVECEMRNLNCSSSLWHPLDFWGKGKAFAILRAEEQTMTKSWAFVQSEHITSSRFLRETKIVRHFEDKRTDDDEILSFRSVRTHITLSIFEKARSVRGFESKRTGDGEIMSFRSVRIHEILSIFERNEKHSPFWG